ncbi:hypothetical protein ACROYT_G031431 [Oculina patagonica]
MRRAQKRSALKLRMINVMNRKKTLTTTSGLPMRHACADNYAVFASDGGKRWCELLPSNSHNNAAKLTEKQQSHHYSLTFKNPCANVTCVNRGQCKPVSFRHGTHKCLCQPGFLGTRCEIAPTECKHYSVLSEPERHQNYGRGNNSDSSLIPGWYRFQSTYYTKMLNRCIPHHRCLTDITGWLNSTHPSLEDGIVTREVCFHGYYDCCYRRVQIRVRECDGFYVYELKPSPAGKFRYCAAP